jgi:hypothetical protein
MDQLHKDIALALDLSEQIVNLAKEKDWSKMEQLDTERMDLLKAVFTSPSFSNKKNSPEVKRKLDTISSLNSEAIDLCSQAKDGMLADGRTLRRGRDAIQAYKEQTTGD